MTNFVICFFPQFLQASLEVFDGIGMAPRATSVGLHDLPSPASMNLDLPSPAMMNIDLPSPATMNIDLPSPATTNIDLPSTSTTSVSSDDSQFCRSPTPTGSSSFEQHTYSLVQCKKRKPAAENTASKDLLSAALSRLSTPGTVEDEFSTFGKMVAHEIRSLSKDNPMQTKIVKKLISEAIFLGSMNNLTINSQIVNVDK